MNIPQLTLALFAAWTLLTLLAGIGLERWTLILTGRARLTDFPADQPHGRPHYRRAMRAHANCVENLPVYAAIVLLLGVTGLSGPLIDTLAVTLMAARVGQTCTHILFAEKATTIGIRFAFFFVQVAVMATLLAMLLGA